VVAGHGGKVAKNKPGGMLTRAQRHVHAAEKRPKIFLQQKRAKGATPPSGVTGQMEIAGILKEVLCRQHGEQRAQPTSLRIRAARRAPVRLRRSRSRIYAAELAVCAVRQ